jgi:hypothetical protein
MRKNRFYPKKFEQFKARILRHSFENIPYGDILND